MDGSILLIALVRLPCSTSPGGPALKSGDTGRARAGWARWPGKRR